MNYATACSGIDAPGTAWKPLGWRPAFHAEIEPFPCAVLAHHDPDVPNLGNMEAITREQIEGFKPVSVFVAGTPCQSFSVAGLRRGMADPRGNLALVFLRLVDWLRPDHFVWENVPGFLSDEGGATARAFLDAVEELGYVVDIDILDAQFFDVPQRRRRIFICAQSTESILRQKTISSALTILQCLMESLVLTLAVLRNLSPIDWAENLAFDAGKHELSLKRRTELFGLQKAGSASMLQENLDVLRRWCEREQGVLESHHGKSSQADSKSTGATKSRGSIREKQDWRDECLNTDTSWKRASVDCFSTLNECITSTATSGTIESKIFTCAKATLYIAAHITQSLDSSPCFWTAASSALTAVKGFTNYARSATSSLFTNVEWVQSWSDFLEQAEPAIQSLESLRVECFGEILPVFESLCWNFKKSREAGSRVAGTIKACAGKSGTPNGAEEIDRLIVNALDTFSGGPDEPGMKQQSFASTQSGVRRLTPVECEKLQGFPPSHTAIPHRGKLAADGPRYKSIGNSMCVNVMRWIGERIQLVNDIGKRIEAVTSLPLPTPAAQARKENP